MDLAAYRKYEPRLRAALGETVHPYHLCAHWAITMIEKWRGEHSAVNRVAYVFEEGSEGTNALLRTLRSMAERFPEGFHRTSPVTIASKQDFVQLQAADLLAYETFKAARRELGFNKRDHRKSLIGLLESGEVEYLDALLRSEYFEHLLSFLPDGS